MKKTMIWMVVLLLTVAGRAWGQLVKDARNPVEGYVIT